MTVAARARVERDGWSLLLAPALAELPSRLGLELIDRALKIAGGADDRPLRRSRHASTYQIRLGTPLSGETEVFVKLLDAPRGLKAVRRLFLAPARRADAGHSRRAGRGGLRGGADIDARR